MHSFLLAGTMLLGVAAGATAGAALSQGTKPVTMTATASHLKTSGGGCYPAVTASGEALLRSFAESNAIAHWKLAAAAAGATSDWDTAASQSTTCKRKGAVNKWECVVSGQPCSGAGPGNNPSGPACYPELVATGGWAKLESGAQNKVRDQWQHDAGDAHGTNYKWWVRAHNSDITCHHDGKKPLVRQWQCVARAEPCL